MRPTWDQVWMHMAHTIASRSLCDRDKVGAVIVDAVNRVVSVGYNGPPAAFRHLNETCQHWCTYAQAGGQPNYDHCPSLHAEQNALIVADRSLFQRGTIYVSSHLCMTCAKLIANSGIRRVVVDGHDKELAQRRSSHRVYEFLNDVGVIVSVQSE